MRQRYRLIGNTPCCMLAEKACVGKDILLVSCTAQRCRSHHAGAKAYDAGVAEGLATAHACGMTGVRHHRPFIDSCYRASCRPQFPRTSQQRPEVPLTAPPEKERTRLCHPCLSAYSMHDRGPRFLCIAPSSLHPLSRCRRPRQYALYATQRHGISPN